MPAENYYTESIALHDLGSLLSQFTNVGGANINASLRAGGGRAGPATHDDVTSYASRLSNGANLAQGANVDWPGPVAEVTAFTASQRTRSGNATSTTRQSRFGNSAGTYGAVFAATTDGTQTWTTSAMQDVSNATTYRPGGGSWTGSDFTSTGVYIVGFSTSADGGTGHWTSIFGTLTYNPLPGGFIFLLQLVGLGALPFVGAMDFRQFLSYLSWRRAYHPRQTILTGDEVKTAWDEIRAYRHPVYSWA